MLKITCYVKMSFSENCRLYDSNVFRNELFYFYAGTYENPA